MLNQSKKTSLPSLINIGWNLLYVENLLFLSVKSRVLMSLRGEQDDLNWYELYGPNVPHHTVEKKSPEMQPATAEETNYGPVLNEVTSKNNGSESLGNFEEQRVQVVKVTVDGRFGQVSNASNGEDLKVVLLSELEQTIHVKGRMKSSGDAVEV